MAATKAFGAILVAVACMGASPALAAPAPALQASQLAEREAWAAAAEAWQRVLEQPHVGLDARHQAMVGLGRALARAGAAQEAEAALLSVPASAGARWGEAKLALAELRRSQGREAEAAEAAEAALPSLSARDAERGRMLAADGWFAAAEYESALAHYREVAQAGGPEAERAAYAWGWALARLDQPEAALGTWRNALARYPDSPHARAARLALGNIALARGDAAGAAESFSAAAAGDGALLARAEFLAAEARADAGDWAGALNRYQAVPPDAPMAEAASYGAAYVLWRSGNLEVARARFDSWLALHPQGSLRPAVHLALGAIAEAQGAVAEAEAAYVRAEAVAPTSTWAEEATYRRARLALLDGRPEEAEALSRRQLQRFPQGSLWPSAAYLRAEALLAMGRAEDAVGAFAELGRLGPTQWPGAGEGEVAFKMGMAQWHAGRLAEAARALSRVATGPRVPEARFWEAEARYRLGQHAEARRKYAEAGGMGGPRAGDAAYGEAWSALRLGDANGAMAAFTRAANQLPPGTTRLDARRQLAQLKLEARDWQGARAALAAWLAESPSGEVASEARFLQALAAYRAGELSEAEKAFEAFVKAEAASTRVPEAQLWLGRARQRLGRSGEAVAPLEAASNHPLAGDSLRLEATEALAAAYQATGQNAQAQAALERLRQHRDLSPERQGQARQALIRLLVNQGQGAKAFEMMTERGQSPPSDVALEELLELFAKSGEDSYIVKAYGVMARPSARASYLMGQALLRVGDVARVQSLVEELKPTAPPELLRPLQALLAKALVGQNKLGEAREAYLTLASMGGGPGPVAEATLEAARLAVRSQDAVAAERLFRQVAGQGQAPAERRREAWMGLGDLQRAGAKAGLALVSYRQAKAVSPAGSLGSALASYWAATMLVELKQPAEALRELRSLRMPASGAEALAALVRLKEGEALERLGRWREAIAAYEGMAASAPAEAKSEAANRLNWIRRNVPEGDRR